MAFVLLHVPFRKGDTMIFTERVKLWEKVFDR